MSKGPAITQSENLAPWLWKRERAPVNKNPGPALKPSVNYTDPMPCLEDGRETEEFIQTGCVQNTAPGLMPLSGNQPVIPMKLSEVLEDGKNTYPVESPCVESTNLASAPMAGNSGMIRQDVGLVLENVKMSKGLT